MAAVGLAADVANLFCRVLFYVLPPFGLAHSVCVVLIGSSVALEMTRDP